jgi:hypothetical protein
VSKTRARPVARGSGSATLAQIKSCCPNLRGINYFDVDLTRTEGFNWRLDTSSSALEGFRDLALDPFFRTRW